MRIGAKIGGLVVVAALAAAACGRAPQAPAWSDYRDERTGFTIRHPAGWARAELSPDSGEVRFIPPGTVAPPAEFISVFTVATAAAPSELEIRQHVFSLLPIHGVSGFLQDQRTNADVLWYRFELTGSTGSTEWASVGAAAAGPARMQIAVCAKPLAQWRDGQRQCDAVIRSFLPGVLTGR